MNPSKMRRAPIAVFDSGVGGISVLAELISLMPQENFIYFGDSKNAPYGARCPDDVARLTDSHISALIQMGAKAAVVACNTATGVAIASLREKYHTIPIIGIEPAIKPAALAFPGGRILVTATPVTLSSAKFRHLMEQYTTVAEIIPAPCARLARIIESGTLSGEILQNYLTEELSPHLTKPADAVVLGCTHYPFVRDTIVAVTKAAAIFDGGNGTARETQKRLREAGLLTDSQEPGSVSILNSDPVHIPFCKQLLDLALRRLAAPQKA